MSVSIDTLEDWWRAAASPEPLIILGAGRWGRVWSDVAIAARSGASNIYLVARSNLMETRKWQAQDTRRGELAIVATVEGAFDRAGRGASAIIASRPRDHARDISACLDACCPVLVEKPFVSDPGDARPRLQRASERGVLLGIGTEFSLLPELHLLAEAVGKWSGEVVLSWDDPVAEVRHGAVKRGHNEVALLGDLLPHAFSMFQVLGTRAPAASWKVADAVQDNENKTGELALELGTIRCKLVANKAAIKRRRSLTVDCNDGRNFHLDFSETPTRLFLNGVPISIPERWAVLTSTLRLELGAWWCALRGMGETAAIVSSLADHVELAHQLGSALRNPWVGVCAPRSTGP